MAVLLPTMTFAATAEVVRYQGAVPVLVDCDPITLNMDLDDADRKLTDLLAGRTPMVRDLMPVGIMPVHVGGLMIDMDSLKNFADKQDLWIVEDAAHALPAAYRRPLEEGGREIGRWRRSGENTAKVTCYSFYANKTITTGEGGMAVTDNDDIADRMRQMSLHGLSRYHGRLETIFRRRVLGLPDRGARIQVQHHRHRFGYRNTPAETRRGDETRARNNRSSVP